MTAADGPVDYLDRIGKRATATPTTQAAAEAMAEAMSTAVRTALGGDMTMSRAGTVTVTAIYADGQASVGVGGAWRLANYGRRRVVGARARHRSALRTPWGPRARVRGSVSAGHDIAAAAREPMLTAGVDVVRTNVRNRSL